MPISRPGRRQREFGYEMATQHTAVTGRTTYNVTAAQNDTQLIAAEPSHAIRVYALEVTQASVVSSTLSRLIFRSIGSATSALTGSLHVSRELRLPYNDNGWFQTAPGDGLFMSTPGQSMTLHITAGCIRPVAVGGSF